MLVMFIVRDCTIKMAVKQVIDCICSYSFLRFPRFIAFVLGLQNGTEYFLCSYSSKLYSNFAVQLFMTLNLTTCNDPVHSSRRHSEGLGPFYYLFVYLLEFH
jgi:nicotinamide riboside transporter PnuC